MFMLHAVTCVYHVAFVESVDRTAAPRAPPGRGNAVLHRLHTPVARWGRFRRVAALLCGSRNAQRAGCVASCQILDAGAATTTTESDRGWVEDTVRKVVYLAVEEGVTLSTGFFTSCSAAATNILSTSCTHSYSVPSSIYSEHVEDMRLRSSLLRIMKNQSELQT